MCVGVGSGVNLPSSVIVWLLWIAVSCCQCTWLVACSTEEVTPAREHSDGHLLSVENCH